MNYTIRRERLEDSAAIHQLTKLAFSTMPYSSGTEHLIVDALRAEGALLVSLVALADDLVVGHIAFSPVNLSSGDQGWYALGPVSVEPRFQRKGIGSALIREGLKALEEAGACGCVLVGNPDYYKRFGFRYDDALELEDAPREASMALRWNAPLTRAKVRFHPAFSHC